MNFWNLTVVLLSALTAACSGNPAGSSGDGAKPRILALTTPLWRKPGDLLLRTTEAAGGDLLAQHLSEEQLVLRQSGATSAPGVPAPSAAAFRLSQAEKRAEPAPGDAWTAAGGAICDCRAARMTPLPAGYVFDATAATLTRNGSALTTAGPTVLEALLSPNGDRIAVLSAEGKWRGSVQPALGRRGPDGPYFIEILAVDSGQRALPPLRFPGRLSPDTRPWQGCWTAKQDRLVYTDLTHQNLWLVPVDKTGE